MENKNYIFVGSYIGKNNYEKLINEYFKSENGVSNSEYERVVYEGFKKKSKNVYFLCAPSCGVFPFNTNKMFTHFSSDEIEICNHCNIAGLTHVSKYFALKKKLSKLIRDYSLGKETIVIGCEIHLPYLKILKYSKQKYGFKTCLIVPDLPENYIGINNFIYRKIKEKNNRECYKIGNKFVDSYLFFTNKMLNHFQVENKPYLIKEGILENINENCFQKNERSCAFIGKTNKINGVELILQAAKKMPTFTFDFYGSGDMDEIIRNSNLDNVTHKGFANPNDIDFILKEYNILLCPRFAADYTAVSFPSKIIKYISHCKKVVTIKLPCYSEKFNNLFYLMEKEDSDSLVNSIIAAFKDNNKKMQEIVNKNLNDLLQDNYTTDFISILANL